VSDFSLLLVKIGYLALLWVFVLTVAAVMRRDLFPRRRTVNAAVPAAPAKAAKPAKPGKVHRGGPRTLVVTAGTLAGTTIQLTEQPITLGRAPDNTIVLDDDYASGYHARLRPYEGRWLVEDLGSTNGTYLDKQKVTSPTVVPTGVPVKVGKTLLELRK
jgi:pSer/pThr/pTyr-binding forkhead associated (FHA) protein